MSKLAIHGGTPVYTGTFPSWPYWNDEEKQNLLRALSAGQWGTLGAEALSFAGEFAAYIGTRHAVCVNTGTQALEMMLRGCGIGYGDDVITTPYTFSATVSSIAWCGAMPVMADIDPDTGNIDPGSLEGCITPATKAILLVHVAGRPCDMDAIGEFAKKKGILVLEDSAHAHGSQWKGVRCGHLGDASAFSFQGSKAITGGEGGCVTT
ncbi:MAG: aminotransferase class I/II-fold pyridoxal phosphate-dependent enzyme, partial [Abditibacteriota bacterium]|nr:aminotransferase class I/II-fold pyridoxal phosphate-dependent enzyme [Abditibacteriota bacterium]